MPLFNSLTPTVVFQELPNEISLCFSITGCKVGCKGCHSTELWDANAGTELSNAKFEQYLNRYESLISAVVFMGGEWQPELLNQKLKNAKQRGLKTCLYSGQELVDKCLDKHLDYLKLGPWRQDLGGLESSTTNQRFIELTSGNLLNHLFVKEPLNSVNKTNTIDINTVDTNIVDTNIVDNNRKTFKGNHDA